MVFGTHEAEMPKKVPTFLQFIKSCGKGVEGKTRFGIEVVWLPGEYDNVTIQTHAFRFICSPNHLLYNGFQQYTSDIKLEHTYKRVDIVVTSIRDATIELLESPRVKGNWSKMGKNAFKFKEL